MKLLAADEAWSQISESSKAQLSHSNVIAETATRDGLVDFVEIKFGSFHPLRFLRVDRSFHLIVQDIRQVLVVPVDVLIPMDDALKVIPSLDLDSFNAHVE